MIPLALVAVAPKIIGLAIVAVALMLIICTMVACDLWGQIKQ